MFVSQYKKFINNLAIREWEIWVYYSPNSPNSFISFISLIPLIPHISLFPNSYLLYIQTKFIPIVPNCEFSPEVV